MSVLNQMMKDLEKRGAVTAAVPGVMPPRRRRPWWLWLLPLPVLVLAAGFWLELAPEPAPELAPAQAKVAPVAESGAQQPGSPAATQPASPTVAAPKAVPGQPPVVAQPLPKPLPKAVAQEAKAPAPAPVAKAAPPTKVKEGQVKPQVVSAPGLALTSRTLTRAEEAAQQYQLGLRQQQQGQLVQAGQAWQRALELDPGLVQARQALSGQWQAQGRSQEAAQLLETGLSLAPQAHPLRLALARLMVQSGQLQAAYQLLMAQTPAVEGAPDYHLLLAGLARELGHWQQASDSYRALLGQRPDQGRLWLALALSEEGRGEPQQARLAYRQALNAQSLSRQGQDYARGRLRALGEG